MRFQTHDVINQPDPLGSVNLFTADLTLQAAVDACGAGWARPRLEVYGALAGGELAEHGRLANRFPRQLVSHDAYGRRRRQNSGFMGIWAA
jgi:putative acyl-CoA dehydrogenase